MNEKWLDTLENGTLGAKRFLAATSLLAVGVAFELAAKFDPAVRREIAAWAEDEIFAMGVLPDGPMMSLQKVGDRVKFLGMGEAPSDVAILFKNVDAALLVFTGQIGTHIAAAEKRFIVRGDLTESMKISRTLSMVQAYLFPGLIVNKTFRRPPKFTGEQLLIKAKIYAALMPVLATKIGKKAA
jgi:hypothetical protein